MPGPGEYVSDGTTWRPADRMLRHPNSSKNGEIPGDPIRGPDGKPLFMPDPAAVESLKKELGFGPDEDIPIEKLAVPAVRWQTQKATNVVDAIGELVKAMNVRQSGAGVVPSAGPDETGRLAMLDAMLADPEIAEILAHRKSSQVSISQEVPPTQTVKPLSPEGSAPARRGVVRPGAP